ncbi:MAG: cyclic nucleotide-binding domain-containing protein, partial [Pirellulaceae bacterium]|nr:cyclic nucleotide-binding domain-containing protein [Pirellulaceae bacterium]
MEDRLTIQTLNGDDDWGMVQTFWYSVYVEEMKKQISSADHISKRLEDMTVQDGQVHCVFSNGRLVATLRRNMVTELGSSSHTWSDFRIKSLETKTDLACVSYSSKLVISPDYRSSTLMARLVSHAYANACETGLQIDLLYCLPRLVPLYKRLGFVAIPGSRYQPGVGILIPMALLINDIEYLKKTRSPFCRYFKGSKLTDSARDAFRSSYADATGSTEGPDVSPIETSLSGLFDDYWGEVSQAKPTIKPEFWKNLTSFGLTFRVPEQEVIIGEGEPSTHLYIVLSGSVEVESSINGQPRIISVLGPGQVFGESSLAPPNRSSDTVRAITDVEI